jgi:hypothetical protein
MPIILFVCFIVTSFQSDDQRSTGIVCLDYAILQGANQ